MPLEPTATDSPAPPGDDLPRAMSYLTTPEKQRLQREWPGSDADVLGYANVSQTQLSIARYYGGATIHGAHYVHFPATDELWRADVLALVHGWRRTDALARELPAMPAQIQGELL